MATFYLKYRPQTFSELDLDDVRESLTRLVKSGNLPHAFLFAGPKGIGKTSAARVLAKVVNCESVNKSKVEPCNKCEQCKSITNGSNIDVIELDAASHRGIDDVRALRDAVKLSPVSARKKVYIIDEAHMLTPEASNALLKTLEEPPDHVLFILATTNPEKLIETIRSRTTIIAFHKASEKEVLRCLERIIKGQKLKIKDDVLKLISRSCGGSFRDAVKILEQVVNEKVKLDPESIGDFLNKRIVVNPSQFINLMIDGDVKKCLEEVAKLTQAGYSVSDFIQELIELLRKHLLAKVGIGEDELPKLSKEDVICLIKLLQEAGEEVKTAFIESLPLEIAIIKWCDISVPTEFQEEVADISQIKKAEEKKIEIKKAFTEVQTLGAGAREKLKDVSDDVWKKILETVKPINTSVEALLRAAKPVGFDGVTLTLGVFYKFHKERLEDIKHRRILEEVISQVLATPSKVVCMLTEPPKKTVDAVKKEEFVLTENKDEDIVKAAKEIFGS